MAAAIPLAAGERSGPIRVFGPTLIILGALSLVAGLVVWTAVSARLKAERIPIAGEASVTAVSPGAAGSEGPYHVRGPISALAGAAVSETRAVALPAAHGFEEYTGLTAGEIARVREERVYLGAGDESVDARMTALWTSMNASALLRTALLLSASAFGVAALVMVFGAALVVIGIALMAVRRELRELAGIVVVAARPRTIPTGQGPA
ncbi:MAG: hypothetical protein LBD97_05435 [Bifidobacteriaceae bacterium]|jgi:hypothetical protein|nr:hypothetical protein [Bifidobacteriaceae bacterium]